jgi:esterase/lipase
MALTYDWRGYGASTGKREYTLSDKDLGAAINFMRAQGAKQIVLVGGSLGGMASLKQASIKQLAGLGVISSPLQAPGFVVSPDEIKTVNAPKFFVAGKPDTTVPYTETTAIYEIVSQPKTLQTYGGSAHGTDILKTSDHDRVDIDTAAE